MSQVTITQNGSEYSADPSHGHTHLNGHVTFVPPPGGCVLCFDVAVPATNGSKQHTVSAPPGNTEISFQGIAASTIPYSILAPGSTCPSQGGSPKATSGQTITIDSGKP